MKFYIATGIDNVTVHNRLRYQLVQDGHQLTYDWTVHGRVESSERLREVADLMAAGVKEADVVVVLLPGGRGTHVELGMAIATGRTVLLVGDPLEGFAQNGRMCSFYTAERVVRLGWVDDVVDRFRHYVEDQRVVS